MTPVMIYQVITPNVAEFLEYILLNRFRDSEAIILEQHKLIYIDTNDMFCLKYIEKKYRYVPIKNPFTPEFVMKVKGEITRINLFDGEKYNTQTPR